MNLAILKAFDRPIVHKAVGKLSKYAPEILTGIGIAGVLTSTVLIARATTQVEPIIDRHEQELEAAKAKDKMVYASDNKPMYSKNDIRKDIARVYIQTSTDLAKLYWPGVTLEIGSIIAILAAHGIMKRRVVTLMGAYKALEGYFQTYRQRVIDELGVEKDQQFMLGSTTKTIKNKETGEKETIEVLDPGDKKPSLYARWFDKSSTLNWTADPYYSLAFLKNQEAWANDRLRIQGYLYLSQVYEALGFDLDDHPHAQVTGWIFDPNGEGDVYVDFGLYHPRNRDYINGLTDAPLLDFNVQGYILDKVGTYASRRRLGLRR